MLQTTKEQILAFLKRNGSSTVDDLATALGLAGMTVRQHLMMLERDDLVVSQKVRRPTGRPHYVYALTPQGHDIFRKRYDRLVQMLLGELARMEGAELLQTTGEERVLWVVRRLADRLAEEHAPSVKGKDLEERVAIAASILQQEGGFAEWSKVEGGYEIRDYNCLYRGLLQSHYACAWHLRFLTKLLNCEVSHQVDPNCGANCCRYLVYEKKAAESGTARGVGY